MTDPEKEKFVETLITVKALLQEIQILHGRLIGWVKARIAQKFKEGQPLPKPDLEEHRLLARMDQLKAEIRETIEEALRDPGGDPEARERLAEMLGNLQSIETDIDLTNGDDEVQ